MEPNQQEHIRRNKNGLLWNTICNTAFILYLETNNVLGPYDIETLNAINQRFDKTAKFYEIIVNQPNSYNIVRDALEFTGQDGAFKIFNEIGSSSASSSSSNLPDLESRVRKRIQYGVRLPANLFTGRDERLALLHDYMTFQPNGTGSTIIVTQTASVTGLGGIGKTELCRKYIQLHSEYFDGNVIWIQAEREDDMSQDFKTVAKNHLKISLKDVDGLEKDIKTVVDEVYKYFQGKRVLFVFDNAVNSDDEHLDTFLPTRVSTNPAIIITSRDRDFKEMPSKILEIGELKEVEAVEFVKKGLQIVDNSQDEIKKLVVRLQCFPLAIQQAVSFIKERGKLRTFEIREYLTLFEKNTKLLLKSNGKGTTLATNNYSMTTYTTWKITTDLIGSIEEYGELSIKCLNIMSYFTPDRIPIQLLSKCGEATKNSSFEIESALLLLVKYSMINNSHPEEQMLSIHRLVQEHTTKSNRLKLELSKAWALDLQIANDRE